MQEQKKSAVENEDKSDAKASRLRKVPMYTVDAKPLSPSKPDMSQTF